MKGTIRSIVVPLMVTLLARGARAQADEALPALAASPAPATVRIEPPVCTAPAFAVDSFVGILGVELRSEGVERLVVSQLDAQEDMGTLATIRLRAETCDASTSSFTVTIEDKATNKRIAREVSLGDVALSARPRALALSVAELLRASWLELALPEAPPAQVAVPAGVRDALVREITTAVPAPAAGPLPWSAGRLREVFVSAAWRAFPSTRLALYGGRAGIAVPVLTPSFLLRAEGAALSGATQDVLGGIHIGQVSGAVGLLFASPRGETVTVAVGPLVELGVGWASGNPVDATTSSYVGSGLIGTASLVTSVGIRVSRTWQIVFDIEGGTALVPLQARSDARVVTGIDGAMFGLGLGVAQWR